MEDTLKRSILLREVKDHLIRKNTSGQSEIVAREQCPAIPK